MKVSETHVQAMAASPAVFRENLLIDCDAGPRRFADVLDPWQVETFAVIDPSLRRAAGHQVDAPIRRAWVELTRGSGKTLSLAAAACWVLCFAHRQASLVAAACDRDQAKLLRDGIDKLVRLNPWLAKQLKVDQYRIKSERTGSTLDVLASEVGGSYGLTPDVVILDEVAMWANRELFDSLLSACAKRANSLLIVLTNAGFTESWVWPVRESVRTDVNWHFNAHSAPASWISEDHLAEQRRLLPPKVYSRLWENVWTEGSGDALDAALVDAAVTLPGPETAGDPDSTYVLGLDLSTKRDHSAAVVLAAHGQSRRVRVAHSQSWAPGKNGVDLVAVQDAVIELYRRFKCRVYFDPFQAHMMAQVFARHGITTVEYPFTPANTHAMASGLLQSFNESRVDLFPDAALVRDLKRLSIVESRLGAFKLTAPRDATQGHCDRGMAFCIALPAALELCATNTSRVGGVWRGLNGMRGGPATSSQRSNVVNFY